MIKNIDKYEYLFHFLLVILSFLSSFRGVFRAKLKVSFGFLE